MSDRLLCRVVAHNELADPLRASLSMDTTASEVGARIRNRDY